MPGIIAFDNVIDFNVAQFDRIMNVNLKAPMVFTHLAVPHLEKTRGNVEIISSYASSKPSNMFTTYGISKAGVDHFTKCAAMALADKGIRANAINPGAFNFAALN